MYKYNYEYVIDHVLRFRTTVYTALIYLSIECKSLMNIPSVVRCNNVSSNGTHVTVRVLYAVHEGTNYTSFSESLLFPERLGRRRETFKITIPDHSVNETVCALQRASYTNGDYAIRRKSDVSRACVQRERFELYICMRVYNILRTV